MKINQLLSITKQLPYFTKQNLALALGKEGEDLNYWIKKLTREKLLTPLKKGFYISSHYQDTIIHDPKVSELYWMYIANTLRSPSYVSLEYVLSKYGLIAESTFALTSVTLKSSRTYTSDRISFIYRNLKRELYSGYQLLVFGNSGLTVRIAHPYKALFDFLYLKNFKTETSMREYVLDSGRFNWDAFTKAEKLKFVDEVKGSGSRKLEKIITILRKGEIL